MAADIREEQSRLVSWYIGRVSRDINGRSLYRCLADLAARMTNTTRGEIRDLSNRNEHQGRMASQSSLPRNKCTLHIPFLQFQINHRCGIDTSSR